MTLLEISQLLAKAADQMYKAQQFQDAALSAHLNDFDTVEAYTAHLDFNVSMCNLSKAKADELMEKANAANLSLTIKALAA
ncbi:hypothetical protein [Chitinophaga varians]|uniref:hypothetical protein n=1 Tax=Chitinophaga varians TaxID=2202339 RepID=UPI00165F3EB5|nr:hypothetical protein [Chitinophaga varians]MBC9913158.1 hypothetical protein [Chitinophaga varians]